MTDHTIGRHTVTEPAAGPKAIPIRIVAYEGEGLTIAHGALEPPAPRAGETPGMRAGDVKRALAVLLRALADELEATADDPIDDTEHEEGAQ